MSPAMAARIETCLGDVADIVKLIEDWESGLQAPWQKANGKIRRRLDYRIAGWVILFR